MLGALRFGWFDSLQMEDVDEFRLQLAPIFLRAVYGNDVTRQIVWPQPEPDELLEVLNPRRPSGFVVVTMETEANGEIPPHPNTTQQSSKHRGDD